MFSASLICLDMSTSRTTGFHLLASDRLWVGKFHAMSKTTIYGCKHEAAAMPVTSHPRDASFVHYNVQKARGYVIIMVLVAMPIPRSSDHSPRLPGPK